MKENKFKTDGFKMTQDFMSRGIFSDVMIYKEKGGITVIAVVEGKIKLGFKKRTFKSFGSSKDVSDFIDSFIQEM